MDPKLFYLSVARTPDTILCEYSPFRGNYAPIATSILSQIYDNGYQEDKLKQYNVYTLRDNTVIYLAITKDTVRPDEAAKLLDSVAVQLKARVNPISNIDLMLAYGLKIFMKELESQFINFNKSDGMSAVINDVIETKNTMVTNMCIVMERECHINSMITKTVELNNESHKLNINVCVKM